MYAVATASLKKPLFTNSARGFSSQAVQMKDTVQELYLKVLREYKPKAQPTGAEVGQVKDLKLPPPPQVLMINFSIYSQVPKVNEDIAAELAAYDSEATAR
ncbi:hypothetical protein K493DRAFT_306135 [Basidiobolus meristosporus CBS 931.73]|uniref:Uncharacterized protein n=1 Tax=Basidiobolus meristosporus CBS 931.73 TaxID=1314790 RepID=A0A1Y1XUQ6_9FUNG|nr:hypothetical protein K493DRAFT_306135 [Basidiobolus meristosporus CBS 931.73]|eukprot:ORX89014.1 hypothetical protein K493DRAFT_306135 [Basidiobolus meristosporus CBS 931.73]